MIEPGDAPDHRNHDLDDEVPKHQRRRNAERLEEFRRNRARVHRDQAEGELNNPLAWPHENLCACH